jgi:hypothetical protein
LDETIANLQEAVNLHLEGEDPAEYDLVENPTILVIAGGIACHKLSAES